MGTNDRAVISLVLLVCIASRSSLGAAETDVEQKRLSVPLMFVFGDSLVDVGNNNFLPPPAPRAASPYGIDFHAGTAGAVSGRFTNGYNLADLVGIHIYIFTTCIYISICMRMFSFFVMDMDILYKC
jgi:hypothetical protein